MHFPRTTIRRFLFVVALVAADLAYIRGPVNISLLIAAPVLQIGLFKVISSCGSIRTFWIGFEAFGWAGVMTVVLSRIGPLWFGFLDTWLNDAIGSLAKTHSGAGRVIAMVILCEGTPIKDTLPGLLPESLIAGMPILILAAIGGLLTVFLASRLRRTDRTPGAAPEVSTT